MSDRVAVLRTATVAMSSVRPHPQNARRGNAARIEKSLRAHGQYKPIIVHQESGHILAGNNTWRVANEKLGWDKIEVTFISCSDRQALEILAVDNRTSDDAGYDNEALLALLDDIAGSGGSLLAAGFSAADRDELADALERAATEDIPQQGDMPTSGKPRSRHDTARSVVVSLANQEYVDFSAALQRLARHFGTDSDAETIAAAVHRLDSEIGGTS